MEADIPARVEGVGGGSGWRWDGARVIKQTCGWPTHNLARSPGHAFYDKLNEVLDAGGFDRFVEELCAPHYERVGGAGQGATDASTRKGSKSNSSDRATTLKGSKSNSDN